jgi:O-antigen ligase
MKDWRSRTLFLIIAAMMAGLFFSRALLSVTMGLFIVVSFLHGRISLQLRNFITSPLLWSISLLFLMPLISGIWSADKQEWLRVLRIKIPLLLLPLSFAAPFEFSRKQWLTLAKFFVFLVVVGTGWSMFQYAKDIQGVNESYLRAKSIPTLLGNDHIRFSWLVSVGVLLSGWLWWDYRKDNRILSTSMFVAGLWLMIFLHLLAARTGLLSLYCMLLITGGWLVTRNTKPLRGVAMALLIVILPFVAYHTLPSFQNRVRYIIYDFSYLQSDHYLPGGNDAARVISLRAGWDLLGRHGSKGLGSGDIYNETKKWAREKYPSILSTDILYPSSEWLIYGLTCGWAGVAIFSLVMLVPFFVNRKPYLVWLLLNTTAALSFVFDMGLEVQFGVFAYSFVVLWWWKWLKTQKEIPLKDD